ncbi:sigma-54-dependent transcriptional regulator [Robertkochia sediminum]|uniref:sigma-54-dependent transcriptional regulator n=1 Tax=Robertkochia sediminum TaxID=2785326 RepID=UPI00193295BD|nr:sigma-54 dependent transcriptional regulator [Robertkochia sediminum]MBL7473930.1 sigma-54-dependent Fis family transcriptional regulator [Robertkochia sediminum]
MSRVLLIEDDVNFSRMFQKFLERHGHSVDHCSSAEAAYTVLKKNKYDLVFSDLRLPDDDGIQLLSHFKAVDEQLPVILMTGYAQVTTAVEAMKKGAFDYISKPFNQEEVLAVMNNALKKEVLSESVSDAGLPAVKTSVNSQLSEKVRGISKASQKLNEYIALVAPTNMSVLISGESGTGKEVVAKGIHDQSSRKSAPFVPVDCGAIPREIAGSEFFGHLKGSFTGAVNNKKGHFEEANGGTLFLDEVGNLPYEVQVQLLRALQERRIKPIGSSKEIEVDIRVISATNEDLQKAVSDGRFREDLFHRLNEFSIQVPSLTDRKEDLMIFADHFLQQSNAQLGRSVVGFSDEVIGIFQEHQWPGNLRELSNVIKRAVLLCGGDLIEKKNLPPEFIEEALKAEAQPVRMNFSKKENERDLILNALKETGNNKSHAAKLLHITRKTLYNKLKEYGIKA